MSDKPYKVGKGKPPREHQFKKGGKAGPGRPKGSRGKSDYAKLLDERIVVGEDRLGRPIRKSWRHVIDVTLLKKAAQGDNQAIRIVKDFELREAASAACAGPPALTLGDLARAQEEEASRKEFSARLVGLMEREFELKCAGITDPERKQLLAPRTVEALGDYREKHGLTREPLPGSSWFPDPDEDPDPDPDEEPD